LLQELRQLFSLRADEKAIVLTVEIDESVPALLQLDEARVRQILINLLGNALKFTERGAVRLSLALAPGGSDGGDRVALRFVVSDTGIGIPKDFRAQLFMLFSQYRENNIARHGGSGLGLVISRRLARLMGGGHPL